MLEGVVWSRALVRFSTMCVTFSTGGSLGRDILFWNSSAILDTRSGDVLGGCNLKHL